MKVPEENEIYNLFRARLTGSDGNSFSEDNWDDMEQLLDDQSRKRRVVMWPYRLSAGIAAALLLFVAYYFINPQAPAANRITKSNGRLVKPATGSETDAPSVIPGNSDHSSLYSDVIAAITKNHKTQGTGRNLVLYKAEALPGDVESSQRTDSVSPVIIDLAVSAIHKNIADSTSFTLPEALVVTDTKEHKSPTAPGKKINKPGPVFKPQFALSVLGAPDINSVSKLSGGGSTGGNFGLQLSMQITKKLSISSGAFYSIRPYQTGSGNYKPQAANWWATRFGSLGKPEYVSANCKVLDIPVNVDFQLFNNSTSKLMIGSGLSSYFMLNETYHFSFADPSVSASTFEINNRNQHLFGVVNLNATYERKVNNRFGVLVQPYLKLPVTQIGFGQVDLKSAGVAVGLSWNINSLK